MRWRPILLAACVLPALLTGCLDGESPFGSMKDPVGASTFQDGESNATVWRIDLAGRFHLPNGIRFWVAADNATCATRGLVEIDDNATLGCHGEDGTLRHTVFATDKDRDGRLDHGDALEVRRGNDTPFAGPVEMTIALHPEMPLFLLTKRFDATGPRPGLAVELMT